MDYYPPKELIFQCNKCHVDSILHIHWKNSVTYQFCKSCKRQNRIECKNGEIKKVS